MRASRRLSRFLAFLIFIITDRKFLMRWCVSFWRNKNLYIGHICFDHQFSLKFQFRRLDLILVVYSRFFQVKTLNTNTGFTRLLFPTESTRTHPSTYRVTHLPQVSRRAHMACTAPELKSLRHAFRHWKATTGAATFSRSIASESEQKQSSCGLIPNTTVARSTKHEI